MFVSQTIDASSPLLALLTLVSHFLSALDGWTDGRTDFHFSFYYCIFKIKCVNKTCHFQDFTNALETYGRTDKAAHRDARTHLKIDL